MDFTFTLSEIKETTQKVLEAAGQRKVWAFHGEMGAGKTTFIHALCESLGVTTAIGSPTYSIINEYHSSSGETIYHMDWYRLRDEEEALQAGVEDTLLTGKLCLVEWPDKAPGLLPENTFHLSIKALSAESRSITVID